MAAPEGRPHPIAFWLCVGLSVLIVIASWFTITRDHLLETFPALRAETNTVVERLRAMENDTRPARREVMQTAVPIREYYDTLREGARQRKEALDIVTSIMKQELNN